MSRPKIFLACITMLTLPTSVHAWNGFDVERGSGIEVADGTYLQEGKTVEIYDYGSESYKDITIRYLGLYASYTELGAYDQESRMFRVFEMERR